MNLDRISELMHQQEHIIMDISDNANERFTFCLLTLCRVLTTNLLTCAYIQWATGKVVRYGSAWGLFQGTGPSQ